MNVVVVLGLLIVSGSAAAADRCEPIQTFATGRVPLRTFLVATNGSDTTGDGTAARPFRTLQRAAQGVRPGDALRLAPGVYAGGTYLDRVAGTASAPIWIGGRSGDPRPVIEGGTGALHISRARYLIIENLEIRGATGNGINCDDGGEYANGDATRFVIFRNLSIHDIGTGGNQDGLKLSGVNDFWVLDGVFEKTSAGGSAIDHVGCHAGLIARCRFTDTGSNAVQCKGGSENLEIRGNRFVNAGQRAINIGGSTGFQFFRPPLKTNEVNFEARDIRVIANEFEGSDTPLAFVGTVDSVALHNTIIEPRRWIFRILQETTSTATYSFAPCGRNLLANNLIYYRRAQVSTPVNIGAGTDAASFRFSHNLWYAADQPAQSRPGLPSAETNSVAGLDPQFADRLNRDYSVVEKSPATARGVGLPQIRSDLRELCYANPPTIGAFEVSTRTADSDGDGLSDWGEGVAGTDPLNAESVFKLELVRGDRAAVEFSWNTLADRAYRIEWRDLAPSVSSWNTGAFELGTGAASTYRAAPSSASAQIFRVGVVAAE